MPMGDGSGMSHCLLVCLVSLSLCLASVGAISTSTGACTHVEGEYGSALSLSGDSMCTIVRVPIDTQTDQLVQAAVLLNSLESSGTTLSLSLYLAECDISDSLTYASLTMGVPDRVVSQGRYGALVTLPSSAADGHRACMGIAVTDAAGHAVTPSEDDLSALSLTYAFPGAFTDLGSGDTTVPSTVLAGSELPISLPLTLDGVTDSVSTKTTDTPFALGLQCTEGADPVCVPVPTSPALSLGGDMEGVGCVPYYATGDYTLDILLHTEAGTQVSITTSAFTPVGTCLGVSDYTHYMAHGVTSGTLASNDRSVDYADSSACIIPAVSMYSEGLSENVGSDVKDTTFLDETVTYFLTEVERDAVPDPADMAFFVGASPSDAVYSEGDSSSATGVSTNGPVGAVLGQTTPSLGAYTPMLIVSDTLVLCFLSDGGVSAGGVAAAYETGSSSLRDAFSLYPDAVGATLTVAEAVPALPASESDWSTPISLPTSLSLSGALTEAALEGTSNLTDLVTSWRGIGYQQMLDTLETLSVRICPVSQEASLIYGVGVPVQASSCFTPVNLEHTLPVISQETGAGGTLYSYTATVDAGRMSTGSSYRLALFRAMTPSSEGTLIAASRVFSFAVPEVPENPVPQYIVTAILSGIVVVVVVGGACVLLRRRQEARNSSNKVLGLGGGNYGDVELVSRPGTNGSGGYHTANVTPESGSVRPPTEGESGARDPYLREREREREQVPSGMGADAAFGVVSPPALPPPVAPTMDPADDPYAGMASIMSGYNTVPKREREETSPWDGQGRSMDAVTAATNRYDEYSSDTE
ncbi:hypothetical protein KIPB_008485 [Kipferlia bialata]|uniref:Uncharacterized protein n=1 Tax=Kipferlia bialata TaxID=797122 RepID=A0A9K3D2G2_9EUKA|nr:hypothetical protein KIPB_008485 [Kipferlia bialata]|eukprot:g8485.t1